ncbi:MAG: DUF3267 domain-containing protein [Clostridia bacterium]|nr:DUF3267 domain-containing protein [Clostridia bacterium]
MNHFNELPAGYKTDYVIDAKDNKKIAVLLNLAAFALAGVAGLAVYLLRFKGFNYPKASDMQSIWKTEGFLLLFIVSMVIYMILHEIVHGIAYKIMTKEKLTFGLTWSCAYCGIPGSYVTKRCALISILAPLTVFSAVFLPLCFLTGNFVSFLFILLFAVHFGGC